MAAATPDSMIAMAGSLGGLEPPLEEGRRMASPSALEVAMEEALLHVDHTVMAVGTLLQPAACSNSHTADKGSSGLVVLVVHSLCAYCHP